MDDFTIIPNDLYDALRNGEITLCMFQAMVFLHKWASWDTGVARKVRAGRMVAEQGEEGFSQRTYQKSLQRLHNSGRITSGHQAGSKKSYSVTINNYRALTGTRKDQILNPHQIRDWHNSDKCWGADEGAEAYAESYAEGYAERATIQEINKKLHKNLGQEPTTPLSFSLSSPKDGDTPRLSETEKEESKKPYTEEQFYTLQENDNQTVPNRAYARAVACMVVERFLGQAYCPYHERVELPKFFQLFPIDKYHPNFTDEKYTARSNKICLFLSWLEAQPKLKAKILTVDDFFFHWLNKSNNPKGLRHQFEAAHAAHHKKGDMAGTLKAMKQIKPNGQLNGEVRVKKASHGSAPLPSGHKLCRLCEKEFDAKYGGVLCDACASGEEPIVVRHIDVDEL